jgi:hypothetical protein
MAEKLVFKQTGQNLTVTLPGQEPVTKRIADKAERDAVIQLVKEAAEKPTKANLAKVEKAFTANTEKVKKAIEKAKIQEKAVGKKVRKEEKKAASKSINEVVKTVTEIVGAKGVSEERIKELEKENERLEQELKDKVPAAPEPTPRPYTGEGSRRRY